jgi:hypothetical protein
VSTWTGTRVLKSQRPTAERHAIEPSCRKLLAATNAPTTLTIVVSPRTTDPPPLPPLNYQLDDPIVKVLTEIKLRFALQTTFSGGPILTTMSGPG